MLIRTKTPDPIQKITKGKRTGDLVQVVEHLPSKCEVLSSNPSIGGKIQVSLEGRWAIRFLG
jgi:hypothetical protein